MNNVVLVNSLRFIVLLALQVLIFNSMDLAGFINAYPYILFLILYPIHNNRTLFIFIAFLLGLTLDVFNNSAGVHAMACLVLAYFRESILKFSFGVSYEYHLIRITEKFSSELFIYLLLAVVIHHSTLFIVEIFSYHYALNILLRIGTTGVFTFVLLLLMIALTKSSKK